MPVLSGGRPSAKVPGSGRGLRLEARRGLLSLLRFFGLVGLARRRCRWKHALRGLSGEKPLELLAIDRLVLDQQLGYLVQLFHVLGQDRPRPLARTLDDAVNLLVDRARDLLGVVGRGAHLAPDEGHASRPAEHTGPEPLAHAELHDHLLCSLCDPLEIVRGSGRDLFEHELLCSSPAERHRHLIEQRYERVWRKRSSLGRDTVTPSAWPREMIEILCTGSQCSR